MAVVVIANDMAGAVNYTHTTADSLDWPAVPNDTYFYDLDVKIVYYKDTTGNIVGAYDPAGGSVDSVTGLNTDNTDPANPIVNISVDGATITGSGTLADPLVGSAAIVESVTGLNTDNTDPANPIVQISTDGATIIGDGTPGSPLSSPTDGVESVSGLNTDNTDPKNPIVNISVDNTTITGEGTPTNPLVSTAGSAGASLIFYATDAASPILSYNKLVTSISDPDYNTVPVDLATGIITTTAQLIGELASDEGVIDGNPGIINIATIGNIRRISGAGTATFYFEIYHRDNLGTETLLGTSNATNSVSNASYEQYFASALIVGINFTSTDRVVTKWYANRVAGGSDPSYEIQLGGTTPVKITLPVPASSLPTNEVLNDLLDVTTGLPVTPTNADDGKQLYFDVATDQWITDDSVTFGTVVEDCKTSILTGSIPKGTPVYLAGYDNDLLVVEEADASDPLKMPCIGITADVLDDTNAKKLMTFGKIQGLDTSADPEGTIYYVASGGGLTTTRPTGATDLIQRIAKILKSAVSGGQLLVFNSSRTAGLPNLPTGMVWQGDLNNEPQPVALPSSVNIYNADGSLTGNRLVSLAGFGLAFLDGSDQIITLYPTAGANRVEIGDLTGATPITNTLLEVFGRAKIFGVDINKDVTPDLVKVTEGGFELILQMQTLTAGRTQTFQDADGIIALLTDIPPSSIQDLADVIGVDANTGFVDVIVNTDLNPDGLWLMQTNNTDPTKQIALIFVDGVAGNDCIKIGQVNPADRLGGFGAWDPVANIQAYYLNATDSFAMQMTTNGILFGATGVASGELLIANDLTFKIQAIGSALDVSLTMPVATADRSQIFQDKDGVIALLSDITGGGTTKFYHTTYSYDYVGASGTWNGVSVAAFGLVEINNRWRVGSFAGNGGADGFYINFRLSSEYVAGNNIKIELDFSNDGNVGGGTAHIGVGLTQPNSNNDFGDEADTEYLSQNVAIPVGPGIGTYSQTFSGTTLNPNDQISIVVYRDPGNGGDTNNETLYNATISVEEI